MKSANGIDWKKGTPMITEEMKRLIEENTLGLVATVTPEGRPAVSPKATTVVVDERTILFSDLRSPGTVRNIRSNPAVELNYIDIFRRKACRAGGTASYVAKAEPRFQELTAHFAKWGDLVARMRGAVIVNVTSAQMIKSPAYDAGASEDQLKEQWLKYYTERMK